MEEWGNKLEGRWGARGSGEREQEGEIGGGRESVLVNMRRVLLGDT